MIAFPCPEKKLSVIISGKCPTLKEQLWSGSDGVTGGGTEPNSSPPLIPQTQQINIGVSQAETRLHLGTAKMSPGGMRGTWGWVLWSPSLFALHLCNYQRGNANRCCFSDWNNKSSWHNRVYNSPKGLTTNTCSAYVSDRHNTWVQARSWKNDTFSTAERMEMH